MQVRSIANAEFELDLPRLCITCRLLHNRMKSNVPGLGSTRQAPLLTVCAPYHPFHL